MLSCGSVPSLSSCLTVDVCHVTCVGVGGGNGGGTMTPLQGG